MKSKAFWKSKTFWVNVIAVGALILQSQTDTYVLDVETQAGLLGIVNLILRCVTKENIDWGSA